MIIGNKYNDNLFLYSLIILINEYNFKYKEILAIYYIQFTMLEQIECQTLPLS